MEKKNILTIIFLSITLIALPITTIYANETLWDPDLVKTEPVTTLYTNGTIQDPDYTKIETINQWKSLWDSTGNTSYFSAGKSYLENDIWVFQCGTIGKSIIMVDAELHGSESNAGKALYLSAQWLLSEKTEPNVLLARNLFMFIPVVDVDSSDRGNANKAQSPYGVNLNRNFKNGWSYSSTNTDNYSGLYAASEKETQVMRSLFSTYKPAVYINLHVGAGPYAAYYRYGDLTVTNAMISKIQEYGPERGVIPYSMSSMGSNGLAIGDAHDLGVSSAWLVEAIGSTYAWKQDSTVLNLIKTVYEPKIRLLLLGASAATGSGATIPSDTTWP